MKRTNLRNKYLKSSNEEDRESYAKQRNLCMPLLLFDLKLKNVIDNRKFWETVKSMFLNELISSEKITLVENEKIITGDKQKF